MGNGQSTTTAVGPETMYTATAASAVAAARATALTLSPTSNVKGKTFDRFVQIFLENQDYGIAAGDRMCIQSKTKAGRVRRDARADCFVQPTWHISGP